LLRTAVTPQVYIGVGMGWFVWVSINSVKQD